MLLQIENFTKNFFVEDVGKAQSKIVSVEEEFFYYLTHIVKNIYNNFLTKKVFKMPMLSPISSQNLTAKFSNVKNVYDLERHKLLRIAHKLMETVLNPKTIEKVNVKLAISLLHVSTRTALKQYGFVETATALEFFAKFWNIINVSSPTIGKHKRDIFRDPVKSPDD